MLVSEVMRMVNSGNIRAGGLRIGINNRPPTSVLLVTDVLKSLYATYDNVEHRYVLPFMFNDYEVDKISLGTDIIILCHEE